MSKIIFLIRTSYACPSQWEGVTSDSLCIYIRFRWGRLTVATGKDIKEACSEKSPILIPLPTVRHDLDGFLTNKEMIEAIEKNTEFVFLKDVKTGLMYKEVMGEPCYKNITEQKRYIEIMQCQECHYFDFLSYYAINHGICKHEKREIALEELPFPHWCPLDTDKSIAIDLIESVKNSSR